MCCGLLGEFKDFLKSRGGNVVDLGIGIIIGAAFTSVVNSFVVKIHQIYINMQHKKNK